MPPEVSPVPLEGEQAAASLAAIARAVGQEPREGPFLRTAAELLAATSEEERLLCPGEYAFRLAPFYSCLFDAPYRERRVVAEEGILLVGLLENLLSFMLAFDPARPDPGLLAPFRRDYEALLAPLPPPRNRPSSLRSRAHLALFNFPEASEEPVYGLLEGRFVPPFEACGRSRKRWRRYLYGGGRRLHLATATRLRCERQGADGYITLTPLER